MAQEKSSKKVLGGVGVGGGGNLRRKQEGKGKQVNTRDSRAKIPKRKSCKNKKEKHLKKHARKKLVRGATSKIGVGPEESLST